jgi:hypothetical protein
MINNYEEYILIEPKYDGSINNLIPFSCMGRIKEEIWDTYYGAYENIEEIMAEELYREIFELEEIDEILTFLNQSNIKYWIIEKHN